MNRSPRRHHAGLSGPFNHMIAARSWPLLILLFGILGTAIAIVYTKHYARVWHAKSQQLQQRQQVLHSQWLQLLVDIGSWTNKSHLEHLAKQHHFIFPERTEVLVISATDLAKFSSE